ncbi:MAG TPA: alpha/beta hydrolase [Alphaproteobacteria bacterium]|nr:alpha/beta hydrolase [Alphaproteobacteria bacterium]
MFEGFARTRIKTRGAEINLVQRGSGPPLLLLHGYPQTHAMWHKVAPRLAEAFTVVCADLRGYGDSSKPPSAPDHAPYSKRATAQDMVEVMAALGHARFSVAGHDRGGRVAHRMVLDHEERIDKVAVLDIVPTHKVFASTNKAIATGYYHWFFLIQPNGLPEHLIGLDPDHYLKAKLGRWSASMDGFSAEALAEYLRCFRDPAVIHASCEDYRAAATIDLEHDEADMAHRPANPLLAIWGKKGLMERNFDVLATWRERFQDVRGRALDCGHFLAEERPEETYRELRDFFAA